MWGSTVAQWSALLPHSKMVLGSIPGKAAECLCALPMHMGLLQVLQFPPQKHVRLIDQYELTLGLSVRVDGSLSPNVSQCHPITAGIGACDPDLG